MAETAESLISDILREIYVQANEQDVPDIEFQTALRYLNRYMAEINADGVRLPWVDLTNPADMVYTPTGAINGIISNVAMRLANQFDVQVSATLADAAAKGYEVMLKLGVNVGKQNFPSSLPIGSGNEDWFANDAHFFPDYGEDYNSKY
ncbi:putative head completion protein [Pseudoalteromonas virus vB_PspP-H6/1]|nr:putative head completion protein [Pseudoalteromonas virus vB_PspP-H6/1]